MPFFALLLVLASGARAADDDDPGEQLARELKKMVEVFTAVDQQAADPVDPTIAFYQGAIPSMLRTLDPHSIFFDPGQFEQLKQMENSEQQGLRHHRQRAAGPRDRAAGAAGTPSAKAGLTPGDEILAINGYVLARLEFEQLVQLLTHGAAAESRAGRAPLRQLARVSPDAEPALVDTPSVDRAFPARARHRLCARHQFR